jgi:hypothetical protein
LACDASDIATADPGAVLAIAVEWKIERDAQARAQKERMESFFRGRTAVATQAAAAALHPAPAPPTPEAFEAERQRQLRELGVR